jgi:hypothetical protein
VLRTAAAVLSLLLLACTATPSPTASVNSQAATSSRTGPQISAPPITPPSPPGDNLPTFACKDVTGGTAGASGVNVTAVRLGEELGYDRFVLQFDSQVPQFTVKRQAKADFTGGASGQPITLIGSAGVLVTLRSTSQSDYTGPTDFAPPAYSILKEARTVQAYEGVVQWGLGLASPVCMRAFTLTDPARLVIDFSATS